MKRRDFVRAAVLSPAAAACAVAVNPAQGAEKSAASGRECYEWRTYRLDDRAKQENLHNYLRSAVLPACERLGIGPVGVFTEVGEGAGPSIHVLLTYKDATAFAGAREAIEADAGYKQAAAEHLAAKKDNPAFERIESSLMLAFAGAPQITPPAKKQRVLELRTYENHGEDRARAKVEMFNDGEIQIFPKCGFENVFFGETLAGPDLPNLKYMLAAPSLEANAEGWKTFISHPDFVKMRDDPKYANTEPKITKLYLEPADYSQV